jgi:carboxyl-terminal processing protease
MPLPAMVGIGAVLARKGTNIIVSAIVPNSPAAGQKDLHVGDRILAIAQDTGPAVPVESGNLDAAAALIRGAPGTTVRLKIVSPEEAVTRARVVSIVRTDLRSLSH